VNDPLSIVRPFYQSSYGPNGKVDKLALIAAPNDGSGQKQESPCAERYRFARFRYYVRFAEFFPDFAVRDGRCTEVELLENPAAHLS